MKHRLGPAGAISVSSSPNIVSLCYGIQRLFRPVLRRRDNISIVYTKCHFGGERAWFVCPKCKTRRAKLVMGTEGARCRVCYQLPYRSQNLPRHSEIPT